MHEPIPPGQLTAALFDLREFLSDLLSPVTVAESMSLLLRSPHELVASEIRVWATAQFKGRAGGVPISDYLYHAMEKIRSLGELKVVAQQPLEEYWAELARVLLDYCPDEDRELLLKNLSLSLQTESSLTSSVQILRRQPGSEQPLVSQVLASRAPVVGVGTAALGKSVDSIAQSLRRVSLLVERWKQDLPAAGSGTHSEKQLELMGELLNTVAHQARSAVELDQYLNELRKHGIEAQGDQMIRALGKRLPDWSVVAPANATGASGYSADSPAAAMHRLVALAEDPDEVARHFGEIVKAAIEQFNEGAIGRSVTMLELADRITKEKRVNTNFVETIRKTAHRSLDWERIRHVADVPEKHPLLRRVLAFFPEMSPAILLTDLRSEPKRDRRRLLLTLLEVLGEPARAQAFERLKSFMPNGIGDEEGYFQRNLLVLLRRIHRPAGQVDDAEAELIGYLACHGSSLIVVKEALTTLGQIKHKKAEQALLARLNELEQLVAKPDGASFTTADMQVLLDRTVSALVHQGTRNSLRVVIEHGLKHVPQLGNTAARLAELATQDLTVHKDLVRRLLDVLQKELPGRLLGWLGSKNETLVLAIIAALSGTRAPEVREALESIAHRFATQKYGQAASKALTQLAAPHPPTSEPSPNPASDSGTPVGPARVSGDLELFGLPHLIQSLEDSRVTAELSLTGKDGQTVGLLHLENGKLKSCQAGHLHGNEAFFHLFERPVACSFNLKKHTGGSALQSDFDQPLQQLLPLLLEATRRYDEFQRARALVPDEVALQPSTARATAPPNEQNRDLLRSLWTLVGSGLTPQACEAKISSDPYRIRRALAHWVEEGSLRPVAF